MGGIDEHDAAQVARGEGAIDISGEALFDQVREIASVVHVGMAQYDGIDLFGIKRETAIAADGFFAMALKQAAFQEQPLPIYFDKIHRTRSRACGAVKMNFHRR
jgi:hypothetical protein